MNCKRCLTAFRKAVLLIITLISVCSLNGYAQDKKEDYLKVGGALRYNIYDKSWTQDKSEPKFAWDTWRLNVDARTSGVDLSFEYRFYPGDDAHFIHHGYLGYALNDDLYMKLGVTQVPFGITKYASHSWWFQIPYYVGLEDDYDAGIKFDFTGIKNLTLNIGYFRQAEPNGSPDYSARYSYDITPSEEASVKELNQFNIRATYQLTKDIEVGVSGQFGQNYNSVLEESESSTAFAGHILANFGKFNFKGEYISYDYGVKDNEGNSLDKVQMGAYGYNYYVASEADIYVAGLAYSMDVDCGPITNIQAYVDYSIIDKRKTGFKSSQHLIPGFLITAGSIYTYVDWAFGKNNAWLGSWTNGLAEGTPDADWESRFNINIGYYF
ncbi:hypothetical protein [Marinifilum sp. D714]|uniref:hypothetical protein n=1 Tax=Marinifilum sp. D714 TaxID=2937523 RepID=UPI0027BFCEDE|nr:hypothetical protein [Marinifilum sp. D714]MDQ2178668.1 hypothetical protein [Marinifilum sp. D714]